MSLYESGEGENVKKWEAKNWTYSSDSESERFERGRWTLQEGMAEQIKSYDRISYEFRNWTGFSMIAGSVYLRSLEVSPSLVRFLFKETLH